jgi:hypothetical protein
MEPIGAFENCRALVGRQNSNNVLRIFAKYGGLHFQRPKVNRTGYQIFPRFVVLGDPITAKNLNGPAIPQRLLGRRRFS